MISMRKAWWVSAASLALLAGCGGEEPVTTPVPTPSPSTVSPTPAATPATPETKTPTPSPTPDTKADAPKADAPKVDAPKADAPKVDAPKVDAPKVDAPKGDAKADDSKLTTDEIAEIKKLSADEQTIALAQITCPVGGDHLGAMGVPVKVVAEGKTFFLCCKNCKKQVDSDPKAVVAKLGK